MPSLPIAQWRFLFGTTKNDKVGGVAAAQDGSVYVSGATRGNLDGITNQGYYDAFLTKYNSDGTRAWTRLKGANQLEDEATCVAVAADGSIYIALTSNGYILDGNYGGFIAKYKNDGSEEWSRSLDLKALGLSTPRSIASGRDGEIYTVGGTGGGDAYLEKYSSDGNLEWTRILATPENEIALSVASANDGSIYLSGGTRGNLDGIMNSGSGDAFLAKYKSDGTRVWTRQLGSQVFSISAEDIANAVSVAGDGSVYIAGQTRGNSDGNSNVGNWDAFIAKYSSNGDIEWTKTLGTGESDIAFAIATATDGSVYITGDTAGDLDGNTRGWLLNDTFITKYNSNGVKEWTHLIGIPTDTGTSGIGSKIASANDGSIYIAGTTGLYQLDGRPSNGSLDAYLARYDASKSTTDQDLPIVDGITVKSSIIILQLSGQVKATSLPRYSFKVSTIDARNKVTYRPVSNIALDSRNSARVILTLSGGVPLSSENLRVSYVDPSSAQATKVLQNYADTFITSKSATLASEYRNLNLTGNSVANGTGNALANVIAGNDSANILTGLAGNDTLTGAGGDDTLNGGRGADVIEGGGGNDAISGDGGNDVISGNGGNDIIKGGGDADVISGGAGADEITGGGGADVTTGGRGIDTFLFSLTDSLLSSFDRITDFAIGSDKINGPSKVLAAYVIEAGTVSALTHEGISAVLTPGNFLANGAASFTFGRGVGVRTFLALNNGAAGFSSASDAIVEITGYSGLLTELAVQ